MSLTHTRWWRNLHSLSWANKIRWKITLAFRNYIGKQPAAAESALAADSPRFAAQQNGKRKHKNRIYPKNQPRNMFARDGEKGRKYDVTGNENKKKQFISYSNFSLLLILLVKEINARSREQSFFLLFIFKCLAKKQTSKTHTHTRRTKTNTVARRGIDYYY